MQLLLCIVKFVIKTMCCNVVMNLMTLLIVSYMADDVAI